MNDDSVVVHRLVATSPFGTWHLNGRVWSVVLRWCRVCDDHDERRRTSSFDVWLHGEVCGERVVDVVAVPGIGCAMEEVVVVVVIASWG